MNDVVATAFTSAGIPVTKKPTGLSRRDGERPDGWTLIPWHADVSVVCTSADSYVEASARESSTAAEIAVTRKTPKYTDL